MSANIFSLLDDDEAPKAFAAPANADNKKPAANGKSAGGVKAAGNSSSSTRVKISDSQDGARGGGRGGRGGGAKPYEAQGEDQTFNQRGAGRGRGGGRGNSNRAPRRDGDETERRPRREFDRHVSRAGHGREGDVREKRGTHGKGNWGAAGDSGEQSAEQGEAETEEQAEEAETEVEEDKEMTLAQYEQQQAEARAGLNTVADSRGVDAAAFKKMTLMKRADAQDDGLTVSKKKDIGKKQSSKERKTVETVASGFRFQDTSYGGYERTERPGGRGRGRGRGGRGPMDGGRGGRDSSARIDDASAFPSLGK